MHATHIKNLASILEAGGLLSYHEMKQKGVSYSNIAYDHIQDRRESTMVFASKGGCLHDYVPFHFASKSPMLYTISKGNVPGHKGGQKPLIFLASTVQRVEESKTAYAFTDGHATMKFTWFYDEIEDLQEIDWNIMRAKYWNDTDEDPDRKRRRQAEFLVHKKFPLDLLQGIAVFNAGMQDQVLEILSDAGVELPVKVKKEWYY